jgi:hypothetical protein
MNLEKIFTIKIVNEYVKPLKIFTINNSFILAVYQGKLSNFDLLIKFKQRDSSRKSGWSYIRTPKHIHWTVDLLIKMSHFPDLTKEFIDFLIQKWIETTPNLTAEERNNAIELENFLEENVKEIEKYTSLNSKGEYSIKFLLLLAKLLMQQEKNNKADAFMFINLLKELKNGSDIFSIVSRSTHNGR